MKKLFTVYSSSAGSGKTFTLVKEYVKIALQQPGNFRTILAITFTNKAANEMKSRVVEKLKEMAAPLDSITDRKKKNDAAAYIKELADDLHMPADRIQQNASYVLSLILHDYTDFAVSTIDSFVYRILRAFAYDMQLPVDFDVELDTDRLIAKAVDLLISKAGTDDQVTRLLTGFTEYKASEEYQWQIEGDLQNFARNLLEEESFDKLQRLRHLSLEDFFRIRNKMYTLIAGFGKTITDQASAMIRLIRDHNIPPSAFYHGNSGFYKFIERLSTGDLSRLAPNKYVVETVEAGKWWPSNASTEHRRAIQEIQFELLKQYKLIMQFIGNNATDYHLFGLLYQHIYPLALLNEIERTIHEIRQQTGTIHISEFNKRIAAVIRNEPVPFIYERLGEKYKHYLIDEFQDTSVLQWHNLVPLIDNSLASNNFNMVVGDGKQSIYRWRNGEVEQFVRLPSIYKRRDQPFDREREKNLTYHFDKQKLEVNHRSGRKIVEFNNSFFEYIRNFIPGDLMDIYADLRQKAKEDKPGGYIHFDFFDPKENPEDFGDFNIRRVYEIIQELTRDNHPYRNVAILCRTNSEASTLAKSLLEKEIPVVSSESLLLKNSYEILFLIAWLTFLRDPHPQLELEITRYLTSHGLLEENHWQLGLKRNRKDQDYIPEIFLSMLRNQGFDLDPMQLIRLPVYELAEELIRMFALNRTGDPFVQFFLDVILEFTAKSGTALSEFLDTWDEKKDKLSIVAPEGSEAIRIMTIHKAKGLQFPIVIFPFADESHKLTRRYMWVDLKHAELPELTTAVLKTSQKFMEAGYDELYQEEWDKSFLDMVNLLYVVMTRASERLYILTQLPGKSNDPPASLPGFFYSYLQANQMAPDEHGMYETGTRSVGMIHGNEPPDAGSFRHYTLISNDWRNKAILSFNARERWNMEAPDRQREWGNLVHTVMAQIRTIDDVYPAVARMAAQGIVLGQESEILAAKVTQMLEQPQVRPFFAGDLTIQNETEIIHPSGYSVRPDRVILRGNKAIVIDYKTGKPSEDHSRQVQLYSALLREMGYTPVEAYIVYMDEETGVVKVN